MATGQVRITWNGMGGELDSRVVPYNDNSAGDNALRDALIEMVQDSVVSPGDTIEVRSVE